MQHECTPVTFEARLAQILCELVIHVVFGLVGLVE